MFRSAPDWVKAKLKRPFVFFVVSMVHLYPLLKNFFTRLPYASNGDVRLSLAIFYSNVNKIGSLDFNQIYHLPFLYPLSNTLTIGFTLFGQSVLLMPFFLFGEPNIYALYNGVTIFSYLAAGYGAFLFFKELQEDETVALVTASLYILLPFRVYNLPHLNLMMNFPIPFAFFFLLRYLKTTRKKDLVFLNLFLLFQFLFDLSLGFYLAVSLAFFVLFFIFAQRPLKLRSFALLFVSLLPVVVLVLLVHFPFLQKSISLSPSKPSFNAAQYHPALSFYAAKSSLLLIFNRIWDVWPFFPGFSVCFFYFAAFSSYVTSSWEKILLAFTVGAYVLPGLLAVIFCDPSLTGKINSLAEIGLVLFWCSLAVLVFALRKKIPLALQSVSFLLLSITFITFNPFPGFIDFFNVLARLFPFLNRSRGLRTIYIFPLAVLAIFAFGMRDFLKKKQHKNIYLWTIVLILLLEHVRWPVAMARLPEPDPGMKKIYQMVAPYPQHYGILELPFVPTSSNLYSYFSRYHNKHTYHGHYLLYDDPLHLGDEKSLRLEKGFPGLNDPGLLRKLKVHGLYLIVVSRSFMGYVHDGPTASIWRKVRQNIRDGLVTGMFKEVKEAPYSFLIVLDDSQTGSDANFSIPNFALAGKSLFRFKIRVMEPTRSRIYFNGRLLASKYHSPGEYRISLDFRSQPKLMQVNRLRFLNDRPLTVYDVQLE